MSTLPVTGANRGLVAGLLEQIDALTLERSGRFCRYDGSELLW